MVTGSMEEILGRRGNGTGGEGCYFNRMAGKSLPTS